MEFMFTGFLIYAQVLLFTAPPEMNEPFVSSEKTPRYNQKASEPEEEVQTSKGVGVRPK